MAAAHPHQPDYLGRLPVEVRAQVLASMDYNSLRSAIRASPELLQTFQSWPVLVLSGVLRSGFSPKALHLTLSLTHAPVFVEGDDVITAALDGKPSSPWDAKVDAFLRRLHQQPGEPEFPMPRGLEGLRKALRIYINVESFIQEYLKFTAAVVLGCLPRRPYFKLHPEYRERHSPSDVERQRLQRAILRYEIVCRLFSAYAAHPGHQGINAAPTWNNINPPVSAKAFYSTLKSFEIEEIACVQAFVKRVYDLFFLDLDKDFDTAVRSIEKVWASETDYGIKMLRALEGDDHFPKYLEPSCRFVDADGPYIGAYRDCLSRLGIGFLESFCRWDRSKRREFIINTFDIDGWPQLPDLEIPSDFSYTTDLASRDGPTSSIRVCRDNEPSTLEGEDSLNAGYQFRRQLKKQSWVSHPDRLNRARESGWVFWEYTLSSHISWSAPDTWMRWLPVEFPWKLLERLPWRMCLVSEAEYRKKICPQWYYKPVEGQHLHPQQMIWDEVSQHTLGT